MNGSARNIFIWTLPMDAVVRKTFCDSFIENLSAEELLRAREQNRTEVSCRKFESRVLLRSALSYHLECDPKKLRFSVGVSGRLRLIEPKAADLSFSLAHSGSESIIAIGFGGAVGVDLEQYANGAKSLRVAANFFPTDEFDSIRRASIPEIRALEHWSLKESVVKAFELSVWDGLGAVVFDLDKRKMQLREVLPITSHKLLLALVNIVPSYVSAVAQIVDESDDTAINFEHIVAGEDKTRRVCPAWRLDNARVVPTVC